MFNNAKIAIVIALALGSASVARASDNTGEYSGGAPVQTWQEIQALSQKGGGRTAAYGYAAALPPKVGVQSGKQHHHR